MAKLIPDKLEEFLEDCKDRLIFIFRTVDLLNSWYFRIWLILFLLAAVFTFVMMILAGERATNSDAWEISINSVRSLAFPDIVFMFNAVHYVDITQDSEEQRENNITFVSCDGVKISPCEFAPLSQCVYVNSDSVIATKTSNGLECSLTVQAANNGSDMILGIAVPVTDFQADSQGTETWIPPNQLIYVNLIKTIKEPKGEDEEVIWSKTVDYGSTVAVDGVYNVIFRIGSFEVYHYKENNEYDSWQSLGDIGGFAYFVLMLHVVVMSLVSIVLPNDSKFLGGSR